MENGISPGKMQRSIHRKRKPVKFNYNLHGHPLNQFSSKIFGTEYHPRREMDAYKSLVLSTVEYASTVWDPYQQNAINRLEMVRCRAARYDTNRNGNRSCVTDMLSHLGWKSPENRRKEARLCMLFKIKHELVAINISDRLIESQNSHNARLGNNNYIVPQPKSDYRKTSFFPENKQTTSRHCISSRLGL